MGVWSSIMPLLSTLAAVVIIVHSAEELDAEFRRDLRPRAVDPGTTSYEQPWKSIDSEPLSQQSTQANVWGDDSLEEQTARRRPVRKRKRRPQTSSENEPDDIHRESPPGSYPDKDYHDSHDSHQSEPIRRRRKRPEIRPYQWADEPIERPVRRRGLRRKRPTIDSNPRLSEFDSLTPNLTVTKDDHREKHPLTEQIETFDSEDGRKAKPALDYYDPDPTNVDYNINDDDLKEAKHEEKGQAKLSTSEETTFQESKHNNYHKLSEVQLQDSNEDRGYSNKPINPHNGGDMHEQSLQDEVKEDQQTRPLAEFSKDVLNTNKYDKFNGNEKLVTNTENTEKDATVKAQDYDPIDPYTLKQILKRSNGTSLSEILQRHNLSLTDLLRGRGEAILALHTEPPNDHPPEEPSIESDHQDEAESRYIKRNQAATTEQKPIRNTLDNDEDNSESAIQTEDYTSTNDTETEADNKHVRNIPRIITNRRFPIGIRRKLRMRPMLNSTLKAQLGRDLIALNARKYFRNNRNMTKLKEWKEIIPIMMNRSRSNVDTTTPEVIQSTPTTTIPETYDDTTVPDLENFDTSNSFNDTENSYAKDNEVEAISLSTTEPSTTTNIEILPTETNTAAEKPKVIPISRPAADAFALRRQAFNNRLKRKRLKQKSSTTENPRDDLTKNFFGMANLVSASQFIERTQKPQTTVTQGNTEYATELEDFLTTHTPTTVEDKVKTVRITTSGYTLPSSTQSSIPASTTAQSAKVEIDEILNDRMTSERLAKILRDRNMTLSELVMHRERGSSHVHLADIFHNASKEPNPPEPFLTKSSIEPISKETYPLRAILEANTHDATARPTSPAASAQGNYMHVPVVMDFGNNVNENGENMGIISLFKNKLENEKIDKAEIRKDSNGTPYISSVIRVNTTITNDTNRESRVLGDAEDINGWNELLTLINKHNISTTLDDLTAVTQDILPLDKSKINLEDVDGDGLIILEDLQHLKDFDSNIASGSDEKLEVRMYEASEAITDKPGILNKIPNNTRSVAIATASILGLATLLFLLTYIAFRYKQQRDRLRKKDSFCNERIPSPVFEHRKGHKNNCSSRSISPMISTSNIYTMSTLDSHNGKDSPDYMWNSLRKPFQ